MITGPVETDGRASVYRRFDVGEATGGCFDQLERRHLAFSQAMLTNSFARLLIPVIADTSRGYGLVCSR